MHQPDEPSKSVLIAADKIAPQTPLIVIPAFRTVETASLAFCADRIADAEMPSQKLVVLATA